MRYFCPTDEAEALQLRGRLGRGALPLAGGTDLMVSARAAGWPDSLVSLRRLGWDGITLGDDAVHIGAMTTASVIARDLRDAVPLLASAASWLGGPQVRNRATVGGNLCTASPAADMVLSLLVLDAQVELVSACGVRRLRVREFVIGPKQTAIGDDELLRAVIVPRPPPNSRPWFRKVGPRSRHFISRVAVAGLLTVFDEGCALRLGLGAVAPTPIRAVRAERFIADTGRLGDAEIAEAARLAAAECSPVDDIRASAEYRRAVVKVLVTRFLHEGAP
ncbi:FAD binding domain-containing protein [Candidatus Fermentibacteria bacterium]|nr:FAD binding domain-containing protein [Candidatus Fermentibacteria bacterium]